MQLFEPLKLGVTFVATWTKPSVKLPTPGASPNESYRGALIELRGELTKAEEEKAEAARAQSELRRSAVNGTLRLTNIKAAWHFGRLLSFTNGGECSWG